MFGKKEGDEPQSIPSQIWQLVSNVKQYHVLETYDVAGIKVTITKDGKYMIHEPSMSVDAKAAYIEISDHLSKNTVSIDYQNTSELEIIKAFEESAETLELENEMRANYKSMMYYLRRDTIGYRIIDVLMNDEMIEDITCENPRVPVGVIHRKYPQFFVMDTNIVFDEKNSKNSMETFGKTLMQLTGNYGTSVSPYVEGSTKQRDRLSAFIASSITPDGPSFTIRRFPQKAVTIDNLLKAGVIPPEAAAYVWSLFDGNGTGMIVGNTGSGKTTILNSLLALVNPRWKVILIEDTEEVRIPQRHGLRLKTRSSTDAFNKEYAVGIGDLLKYSLRQRPQFVVVGEVRLTDVPILFQVYETGHASLSTFHGSSPAKALVRLEAKPIEIMAAQKDDLWFLLHVGRVLEDGVFKRKMLSLVETHLDDKGQLQQVEIISYKPDVHKFEGIDAEEMIKKSERLRYAASLNGIKDIKADIEKKVECLKNITVIGHHDIMEEIHKNYWDWIDSNLKASQDVKAKSMQEAQVKATQETVKAPQEVKPVPVVKPTSPVVKPEPPQETKPSQEEKTKTE